MIWFKLTRSTDNQCQSTRPRSDGASSLHPLPRKQTANQTSDRERVILYAVGHKVLITTQTIEDTYGASNKRHGPAGSDADRWPWELEVATHHYCSPVEDAPVLRLPLGDRRGRVRAARRCDRVGGRAHTSVDARDDNGATASGVAQVNGGPPARLPRPRM
jgi:hypothetical protein